VAKLRAAYQEVLALKPDDVTASSPLKMMDNITLPRYFTLGKVSVSDLNFRAQKAPEVKNLTDQVALLVAGLNQQGYWPTPLYYTTNPYKGTAPIIKANNDYAATMVGDEWDTSPYPVENPVMGISTGAYISNMGVLIQYLQQKTAQ
jgi:hypothetical protein